MRRLAGADPCYAAAVIRICAIAALALAAACSSEPRAGAPPPDTGAAELGSGLKWPEDAPPADACTADADCLVVPVAPDPTDPCCEVTVTAAALSRKYLVHMDEFRKARCAGVRCAELRLPGALLAECGYQARCIKGKCGDACGR